MSRDFETRISKITKQLMITKKKKKNTTDIIINYYDGDSVVILTRKRTFFPDSGSHDTSESNESAILTRTLVNVFDSDILLLLLLS